MQQTNNNVWLAVILIFILRPIRPNYGHLRPLSANKTAGRCHNLAILAVWPQKFFANLRFFGRKERNKNIRKRARGTVTARRPQRLTRWMSGMHVNKKRTLPRMPAQTSITESSRPMDGSFHIGQPCARKHGTHWDVAQLGERG